EAAERHQSVGRNRDRHPAVRLVEAPRVAGHPVERRDRAGVAFLTRRTGWALRPGGTLLIPLERRLALRTRRAGIDDPQRAGAQRVAAVDRPVGADDRRDLL